MAGGAGELHDRLAVPIQAQPLHAFENLFYRILGRAGAIRIFDAEMKFPTVVAGEKPIEQGGAGTAEVQIASGGGGKAGDDGHGRSG